MFNRYRAENTTLGELQNYASAKWTRVSAEYSASVAEMDFEVAPEISRSLIRAVTKGPYGYLPESLSSEVQRSFCQLYSQEFGHEFVTSQVQLIGDIINGLETVIDYVCPIGTPVTVMTPAYMPFLTVPPKTGRRVTEVPLSAVEGTWRIDFEGLRQAFRSGSRLLVLCNPHNPLGKVYSRKELEDVARLADEFGVYVFSDEIHALLAFGSSQHVPYASVSDAAAGHTFTASSASKAWNIPGLKCAQLAAPAAVSDEFWARARHSSSRGASTFGAIATAAAYQDGKPWLDGVRGYLRENRDFLHDLISERLPSVSSVRPDATYLSWFDCRKLGWGPRPATVFLERGGVSLTDGYLCGAAGQGHVRFNFATPQWAIEAIVDRMATAARF